MRGSKARSGASGRSAPRTMFEQFALEPIWRAYSVCEGEDLQVGPLAGGAGAGGGMGRPTDVLVAGEAGEKKACSRQERQGGQLLMGTGVGG